jgi:hypothetical protein
MAAAHPAGGGRGAGHGPRRAAGTTVAVFAAGIAAAACSSAPHASSAARRPAPPATTTTSVPATTSAPAPSGPPGSSGADTTCTAPQLAGSLQGEQGGAGTLEVTIVLRNTGSTLCTMAGYPGLQLLAADGSPQPTSVQPGGSLSFEAVGPSTVSLPAGQRAFFNIGFSDVPGGGQTSCPTAAAVEVTPPGATGHLRVPLQVQACGGALNVSAVFGAGSAATQTTAPPAAG